MNSIFNSNPSSSQNPFTANRAHSNPFTAGQAQNQAVNVVPQNQNVQNQPIIPPSPLNPSNQPNPLNPSNQPNPLNPSNQPNPPVSNPIPVKPRIDDSLLQNHSFVNIHQKISLNLNLSKDERNFVTINGLALFQKDPWKTNHFLTVKSKQPHIGFTHDVLIYSGQTPKCAQIDLIWIKLIKHFAYICDTHEMNGYFIIKQIIKEGRYYEGLFRPKSGLGGKVFEPNIDRIKSFFNTTVSSKPTVNINGKIYKDILQKMVANYSAEWIAFFEIVDKVGFAFGSPDNTARNPQQLASQNGGSAQNQNQSRKLTFKDLLDSNIMVELWKAYQQFALSKGVKPEVLEETTDMAKIKFFQIKRTLFTKVSLLISRLLQFQFSQEMLMEMQPIPVIEAIQFIAKDIETVQIENLIQPQMQNQYIDNGLSLILSAIPFASYIQSDELLAAYFNLPSERNRFMNARQTDRRKRVLEELVKVKLVYFQPLSLWATQQLKRIDNSTSRTRQQREKQRRAQAVELWQSYFQREDANLDIFEDQKWQHWLGMLIENLSIGAIMKSSALRSHMIYYCKRRLKKNSKDFFSLWSSIIRFQNTELYRDMTRAPNEQPPIPDASQRKKPMYTLPPKILRNFDLYTTGRILMSIRDSDYLIEAFSVLTALIKPQNYEEVNYTKQLLTFMYNGHEPDQQALDGGLFDIMMGVIAGALKICCFKKNAQNQVKDLSQIEGIAYLMQGQPIDTEVKFLCELVIQNIRRLDMLETYLFDSKDHLNVTEDVPGIRICIFLCTALQRIPYYSASNIKSARYLIRAIDFLYMCKQTRELILCALSVVFPYNQDRTQAFGSTTTSSDNQTQWSGKRCVQNLIQFLQKEHSIQGDKSKQVKKLKKTISHHFSHMLKSCDSIDQYFTISKDYDQPEIYLTIEREMLRWKFTEVSSLLNVHNRRFRTADWFYTMAGVMGSRELLPIDIDSIIESLRKMRIRNDGNYGAFEPMKMLFKVIERGTVLSQMLQFLKPTGCEHRVIGMIGNEKLSGYKIREVILYESAGNRYTKYRNNSVVEYKNVQAAMSEQSQLLRTVCMYVRLIEEVLRLRLDRQGFGNYALISNLSFVEQTIAKLTTAEHLHQFRSPPTDDVLQAPTKINLIAAIISLLNLYQYKCKFPQKLPWAKREVVMLLNALERHSQNNLAVDQKYQGGRFSLEIEAENQRFYQAYSQDFTFINDKFFDTLLYEMTDFSYQNDDTSLRTTIFAILQLLTQLNCSKLIIHALDDYSYPAPTATLLEMSLTTKCLTKDTHRNLISLLFAHVQYMLDVEAHQHSLQELQNLPHVARTIEAVTEMLHEPVFAKRLIPILPKIRRSFVNFITADDLYKLKCPKIQQINLLNRIALFLFNLLQTTKKTLSQEDFVNIIINNFLIAPENIIKMLFDRITLSSNDYQIDRLPLISTSDQLANYVMQINLTRNTLYRVTYNVLLRVLLATLEFLKKEHLTEILSNILFQNHQLITKRPRELNFEPDVLIKLQLLPFEVIEIGCDSDENIPTTILSHKVTQFTHCNRMHFRKYGPNFMYDSNQAFHLIKAEDDRENLSLEEKKNKIRQDVFFVHLVNCMKSLHFAYQSMAKCYFQVLFAISNTGPVGQNLSVYEMDKTLPKAYERQMLQNKYCMKNKFSFVETLKNFKNTGRIGMGNEEPIILRMVRVVEYFMESVVGVQQNFEQIHVDRVEEVREWGIPRNAVFMERVFIQTRDGCCLNPSQVISAMRSIVNTLSQIFNLIQCSRQLAREYLIFLQYFTSIISRSPCSLRVILQCYSTIMSQYKQLIHLSALSVQPQLSHQQNQSRVDFRQEQDWVAAMNSNYMKLKCDMISSCSEIVFKLYETQRTMRNLQTASRRENPERDSYFFEDVQLEEFKKNVDIFCAVVGQILAECHTIVPEMSLISVDSDCEMNSSIQRSVNYILKLLGQNLNVMKNPMTKVSVFTLFNRFYFSRSQYPVTQWDFHAAQFQKCKQIMVQKVVDDEAPTLCLERMIALDSFCAFAVASEASNFQSELFPIFSQVIYRDPVIVQKFKQQHPNHYQISRNQLQVLPGDKKRYRFTLMANTQTSIDEVIEYKKLLMGLMVGMSTANWSNNLFMTDVNVIYLELLRFKAVSFDHASFVPSRAVEERLKQLIVTDQAPNPPSLLSLNNRQADRPVRQQLSSSSMPRISLYEFICFVHHSELISNYLSLLRTGIEQSKILEEIGGWYLEADEEAQVWQNVEEKITTIFEFYSHWTELLLDNPRIINSLTALYNYVSQDPSYLIEFGGLTLFFELVEPTQLMQQLVFSVVDYCITVTELITKIGRLRWKEAASKKDNRILCLKRCIRLLQKAKIINALKQAQFEDNIYKNVKEQLANAIENEQSSPRNQNRSRANAWARN